MASWFEELTGFEELGPEQVRQNLAVEGEFLVSKANGKRFQFGRLEVPTLQELRERARVAAPACGKTSVSEAVGDIRDIHRNPTNAGAVFQVASQFNLLEMAEPAVTPEKGVGIYEDDHTQGPACAIACGAGTIFRNYLIEVGGQPGQSTAHQIDCLEAVGDALGNHGNCFWEMRNGYALATEEGLSQVSKRIKSLSHDERETLKGRLKVGIQWGTEVTDGAAGHLVSQVYCSALPVAYSGLSTRHWADFASLILEAAYEATLAAAIINHQKTGNPVLYLTLLGGGAFGNDQSWIFRALEKAIRKFRAAPLDVRIVSFGRSKPEVAAFAGSFSEPIAQ